MMYSYWYPLITFLVVLGIIICSIRKEKKGDN
ncbi:hypothetical protein ES705_16359 [subsurface metagenome]